MVNHKSPPYRRPSAALPKQRKLAALAPTRTVLLFCALACGGCGKKEKSTDELIGDLKGPQERERIVAVRTLPQRHGDAARVVPAAIDALNDKVADVRLSRLRSVLELFGEQAKDAVPALTSCPSRPRFSSP